MHASSTAWGEGGSPTPKRSPKADPPTKGRGQGIYLRGGPKKRVFLGGMGGFSIYTSRYSQYLWPPHQPILNQISRHQLGVLPCNSVQILSWGECLMPQVEDSALQNCPHFRRPSKSPSTSPVLLTDQVCNGGSRDLISRFRNLLEGLTELRKTVHLLEYRFATER